MSSEKSATKRMRIDECINLVHKAKMGRMDAQRVDTQPNDDEFEPDFTPALLNLINFAQSSSSSNETRAFTSEERELRKDRGDRLLQLFREQPSLSSSASARRIEKNIERAAIWEEITRKINDEFGEQLEVLTVDKVKKLLTYYKKKEEGNFDNIKSSSLASSSSQKEPLVKLEDVPEPLDLLHQSHPFANFLTLLANGGGGGHTTPPPTTTNDDDGDDDTDGISVSAGEKFYMLKKERHEFVVRLAEHYISRMCFDNSSRSAAVNAERHSMWIKITRQTNDKYAKLLGGLGVEQAKKLYSNCKRRRRIKTEAEATSSISPAASSSSSHSTARPSAERDMDVASDTDGISVEMLSNNLDQIMRGIEKDQEIQRLRKSIDEKDEQIRTLTAFIEKQTTNHKTLLLQLIDEFRTRVANCI